MTISYNVGLNKMSNKLLEQMGQIIKRENLIESPIDNTDIILKENKDKYAVKINKNFSKTGREIILTNSE